MSTRNIAILIDGGYFLKRLPKLVPAQRCSTAEEIARCLRDLCRSHVNQLTRDQQSNWNQHVYRVFYYDSYPYTGKAHHPIENRPIDYAKSDVAKERLALFDCLRKQRKFALRLGKVNKDNDWAIASRLTKPLLRRVKELAALTDPLPEPDQDGNIHLTLNPDQVRALSAAKSIHEMLDTRSVSLGLRQKGVDMRIGVDIASLALSGRVDSMILVAGDSDFVPAAKLARRAGIDFILDPLWQKINSDLFEHIDGLQSGLPRPGAQRAAGAPQDVDHHAE